MPITIGSNITSLQAQRAFANATDKVGTAQERLASGMRINKASDDAAGLAISEQLNSDSKVFTQAIRNVNDGISALTIAESAISELSGIVVRIRELATQSANGAISNTQRESLDEEAQALSKEFTRIQQSTEFNGMGLLDGSTDGIRIQAGYGIDGSVSSGIGDFLGDGTFTHLSSIDFGTRSRSVEFHDFNNDGFRDMIAAHRDINSISVSLGNGDGTFKDSVMNAAGDMTSFIEASDFNGDGILDIAATDNGSDDTGDAQLLIYQGNGNGTFKKAVTFETSDYGDAIASGDYNGDNIIDLAISKGGAGGNDIAVHLGNGDGTFKAYTTYAAGSRPNSVETADLNDDGILDLVAGRYGDGQVAVLLGNGDGTFQTKQDYYSGGQAYDTQIADLNNDGTLDLATLNFGSGSISIHIGNGNGTFQDATTFTAGSGGTRLVLGDTDGNGTEDIAVSNWHGGDLLVFAGNGDGTFQDSTRYDVSGNGISVCLDDINSDGVLDLIGATTSNITIFTGDTRSGVNPLEDFSLKTMSDSLQALAPLDRKLDSLNSQRGFIGAFQSRLEVSKNVLQVSTENFQAAEARIKDADIAQEAANLVRTQILQQASASVLSQANQQPSLALSLLG